MKSNDLIVIFMNKEDANGGEGTKVPLIAHVHSKELLFLLSSQPNVSGMREAFRAPMRSVHGWKKLTLAGFSVCCLQTTIGATTPKQKTIEQTRLMSLM